MVALKPDVRRSPSSYRPLCMLDTAGKLLETLRKSRLLSAIRAAVDLSNHQYGFRKGRSTVDAIHVIVETALEARARRRFSYQIVFLDPLDVRNAFNAVTCRHIMWIDMTEEQQVAFKVLQYLLRMIRNYLKVRVLLFESPEEMHRRKVTGETAQGSVLGADLWYTSYDGIIHMEMPENTGLMGYADDIVAVIVGHNVELGHMYLNQVMR